MTDRDNAGRVEVLKGCSYCWFKVAEYCEIAPQEQEDTDVWCYGHTNGWPEYPTWCPLRPENGGPVTVRLEEEQRNG